jgi:hypothetical protein
MRVEAIVKKDGWFIPHPGFAVGKQKHILLDIPPLPQEKCLMMLFCKLPVY